MTRDRSLDEFAVDETGESAESDVEGDSADAEDGGDTPDVEAAPTEGETDAQTAPAAGSIDDVDPAVATYRWDPDGVECPSCGQSVDRLWSQDGEHVCADCKEW